MEINLPKYRLVKQKELTLSMKTENLKWILI